MSVLDTFIRVRGYRDRAADFYRQAAEPFNLRVRERYLAIADHYIALAEAELSSDRLARKRRLQEMAAARAQGRTGSRPAVPPPVAETDASESRLFAPRVETPVSEPPIADPLPGKLPLSVTSIENPPVPKPATAEPLKLRVIPGGGKGRRGRRSAFSFSPLKGRVR